MDPGIGRDFLNFGFFCKNVHVSRAGKVAILGPRGPLGALSGSLGAVDTFSWGVKTCGGVVLGPRKSCEAPEYQKV